MLLCLCLIPLLGACSYVNESRPSNISMVGTSGLNVDKNGDGSLGKGADAKFDAVTCKLTPEQDAANATAAANAAARSALSAAAAAYSAMYSNVSYEISIGEASVNGDSASVSGSITLRGTNRKTGEDVGGTYSGVVSLSRSGCGWAPTGYKQN